MNPLKKTPYREWLSGLKIGDEVGFEFGTGRFIFTKVKRFTKTGMIRVEYNKKMLFTQKGFNHFSRKIPENRLYPVEVIKKKKEHYENKEITEDILHDLRVWLDKNMDSVEIDEIKAVQSKLLSIMQR